MRQGAALSSLTRVVVRAPAKLNLHLAVGPLRADGYHELTTVFHAVSLSDELTVQRADALTVDVGGADLPTGDGNLAVRAVRLLAAHTGSDPAVALRLRKGIPIAGGCAGGSADAAAALVGCDALWGTALHVDELSTLAARLGSDVPFALHGGTALGTGRGERLTPVLGRGAYDWVLALADGGLATPAVYAELDRRRAAALPPSAGDPSALPPSAGDPSALPPSAGDPSALPPSAGDPSALLAALRAGSPARLGRALCNDLQPAALGLRPALRRVLDRGDELGALGGVVSGSGPTVALLAGDRDHALELAAGLAAEGVCRSVRVARGPVPGARVVDIGPAPGARVVH